MAYGEEFSRSELLGTDTDGCYNPDPETVECDNCGEEIKLDLDCLGAVLYFQIPGIDECYCKKCFPKVLASEWFHKECQVTTDNYDRRRRI